MTTKPHKINLITAIAIGAIIGHQGWWLAAAALAVAIWWRGE
jgi:hypothetical protein